MNVDFAFVCDYAEASSKINALGIGFDTILSPKAPVTHPHFHLVAQFRASMAEAGDKEVTISLIDEDGANVMDPVQVKLTVSRPPAGSFESVARLALGLNGVPFPKFGAYSLHVAVQGREMVRVPLRVARAPQPA